MLKKVSICIFIFVLSFLLVGCSFKKNDNSIFTYAVNTENDEFDYDDLRVSLESTDNDCISDYTCTSKSKIKLVIKAGSVDKKMKKYTVNVGDKKIKINGTNYSIRFIFNEDHIDLKIYE